MDPIFEGESPRARLALLLRHFSELTDDREPWRVMYPLKEVLLLITCATIAGCDDFDDIAAWGEHHLDFLRQHTLSAYATTARLTLAQTCVPEKTNEITAIPDLLDELAEIGQLEGALVTTDAMGCQIGTDKIVAHKADYLLALKG